MGGYTCELTASASYSRLQDFTSKVSKQTLLADKLHEGDRDTHKEGEDCRKDLIRRTSTTAADRGPCARFLYRSLEPRRRQGGRRQTGARGRRRGGWAPGGPSQEAEECVKRS